MRREISPNDGLSSSSPIESSSSSSSSSPSPSPPPSSSADSIKIINDKYRFRGLIYDLAWAIRRNNIDEQNGLFKTLIQNAISSEQKMLLWETLIEQFYIPLHAVRWGEFEEVVNTLVDQYGWDINLVAPGTNDKNPHGILKFAIMVGIHIKADRVCLAP